MEAFGREIVFAACLRNGSIMALFALRRTLRSGVEGQIHKAKTSMGFSWNQDPLGRLKEAKIPALRRRREFLA